MVTVFCVLQSMVVPEDQDGKSGHAVNLIRDLSSPAASAMVSSRKAGGRDESTKSLVSISLYMFISFNLHHKCIGCGGCSRVSQ